MSKDSPIFGIDVHPQYQANLDFGVVKKQGYGFCFVKASQGARYVPTGFAGYFRRAQRTNLIMGVYHFLDSTASGAAQARHFLRTADTVGGPGGMMLAVDFEHYGNQSPGNKHLAEFVAEVKRLTNHPLIVYTAKSFWDSGDPSGDFSRYGADGLWAARYANMAKQPYPRQHYESVKNWGWDEIGGKKADIWQFTSTGLVAGQHIDVNACRRSRDWLLGLTKAPAAQRPPKEEPMSNHEKAIAYAEKIIGAPYHWWTNAAQGLTAGPPAWASDKRPPLPARVKRRGVFCAGVLNLGRRACGLPYLRNGIYPGGTGAWGKLPSVPFDLRKLRRGDVLFRPYRDTRDQGHVAIATGGADAPVIQSFATSMGTVYPGVNKRYTARQSHDGGYYVRIIRREVAWS